MNVRKLALLTAIVVAAAALPDSAARAAGSSPMPSSNMPMEQRERSPEELAKSAYNSGIKQLKRAANYEQDAARATKPEKQEKARGKAQGSYEKALEQFQTAVAHQPAMHEAWNYVGFAQRHLGRYDSALGSYNEALRLKPDYAEAIEYRGEAYLGLDRLEEAQHAYMQLFSGSRDLAAQLLEAMQKYVAQRKENPNGLDAKTLESFAQWVHERASLAQQTASLDTGAPSATWR